MLVIRVSFSQSNDEKETNEIDERRKGSHKKNKINKRLIRVEGEGTEIVPIEGVESCGIDWDNDEDVEWTTAECKQGGSSPIPFLSFRPFWY